MTRKTILMTFAADFLSANRDSVESNYELFE
jgi:hypothetical protein